MSFKKLDQEISFVLFEQFKVHAWDYPYFAGHSKESYQDILKTINQFCQDVISPINKSGDREGCVHDKITKKVTTPKGLKEAHKIYHETGLMALSDTEEQGGFQLPYSIKLVAHELLVGANQSFMIYEGLAHSAGQVMLKCGTDWMQKVAVEKILTGTWTGTMCLTEASIGSAVGDLKTSATRGDDGKFYIQGTKQWISGGEHDLAENIIHLVLARIKGAKDGMEGVSLFFVPKYKFDKNTLAIGEQNDLYCLSIEEKMGIHANSTCLMQFGDNQACEGYLIGEEGKGIQYMFLMMNEARINVGIQGLALGTQAYLNALDYAKQRIQGVSLSAKMQGDGKRVPIIKHPDVQRMLLRQKALMESARGLTLCIGMFLDRSEHAKEQFPEAHGFVELLTPMVKVWNTEVGFETTILAMQTLGGYGFTKDYPIEQYMRDLRIAAIYEGTNGIQSLDFLMRKITMKKGSIFAAFLDYIESLVEDKSVYFYESLTKCKQIGLASLQWIQTQTQNNNIDAAIYNSFPFLMGMSAVVSGFILAQQHAIAKQAIVSATGADAVFYKNKMLTVEFFMDQILPESITNFKKVSQFNSTSLEFDFSAA
jgi:alkylation response protein AidB-like acyl-CoA dehydrogenase